MEEDSIAATGVYEDAKKYYSDPDDRRDFLLGWIVAEI